MTFLEAAKLERGKKEKETRRKPERGEVMNEGKPNTFPSVRCKRMTRGKGKQSQNPQETGSEI